jgi:phosphoribosylformimino-5-aminoimidazole carboxamide ribotide isomerase
MIIFPAIDLKDGAAVRLLRGEMGHATGAFEGRSVNAAAVQAILEAVELPVQLGGGIRDMAAVERWLAAGVKRVILGTAAVKDPDLVRAACRRYPGQVVVSIDARGGRVAVEGWAEESEALAIDLARRFEDAGVAALVYTDIERDGALEGVNLVATAELARAVGIPVIASGGISSLDDIAALMALDDPPLAGAICGRALYDGRIDPASLFQLAASGEDT